MSGEGDYAASLPYGVKMIVRQGFLDHWFTRDAWGDIKPSDGAFSYAVDQGLVERKGGRHVRYRLTNKGRQARHELSLIGGSPVGGEALHPTGATHG